MVKRTLWMILGVVVVVGAIAAYKTYTIKTMIVKMSGQKPAPTVVSSVKAPEEVWQRRLHAVGSLAAVQGVVVTNELDGQVAQIAFESGALVKSGDLLVQQDVALEQAQLASAVASADLAQVNLKRARQLRANDTNAQVELDSAEALARQTTAAVDAIRATIAKKTLRAPFAGRLGIRQINPGQFLRSGTAIVPLQSLDPIYANFALPQQDLTDLKVGQTVEVTVDTFAGQVFTGTINAINARVDDASRNVQVQATLRNPDERLRPGMFASIDVLMPQTSKLITLPQTAVVYNPYGNAVYVVEPGKDPAGVQTLIARQRFVTLGETRGDQVAITKGVKPGEEIVTSGQLKLRNGAVIAINNAVPPTSNAAPTPVNQ
jgi:membrane fusion protein (multidrug efflux system)